MCRLENAIVHISSERKDYVETALLAQHQSLQKAVRVVSAAPHTNVLDKNLRRFYVFLTLVRISSARARTISLRTREQHDAGEHGQACWLYCRHVKFSLREVASKKYPGFAKVWGF
jgi:hypothetical protein